MTQHSTVAQEVFNYPATSITVLTCCAVWLLIYKYKISYSAIGYNFSGTIDH